jgi:hypothetical protein
MDASRWDAASQLFQFSSVCQSVSLDTPYGTIIDEKTAMSYNREELKK